MDEEGRYVRVWVEQASAARVIVDVHYALSNDLYDIAHADIPSGSPFGDGDCGEERFTIYPDGTYVRHMTIYTGLASRCLPLGFNCEPPDVVHEFVETMVIGPAGHQPLDDIDAGVITAIKLFGNHSGLVIPKVRMRPLPLTAA
jgi:hypothetical protein